MILTSIRCFTAVLPLRRSQGPLQFFKTGWNCMDMRLFACSSGDHLKTHTHLLAQRRWIGSLALSPLQRGPQTCRAGLNKLSPLWSCSQSLRPDSRSAWSPVRLKTHSLLRNSAYQANCMEDLLQASTSSCDSDHSSYDSAHTVWQRSPLQNLTVLPGEVHLWWLFPDDVQDGSLLAQYEQLLTAEERSHMMAASTPELRKERLLARVLVRTTLSRYCGAEAHPQSLSFSRNHAGKPHLLRGSSSGEADLHGLQFNLSHTASLLGCAVTAGQLVGLDVEVTNRHTHGDPLRLAKRRFSPAERAALEGYAEGEERAQHFVRLWTLKEAYVKAVGRGISGRPGLKAFSVLLDPIRTGDAAQPGSDQIATIASDSRTTPLYNIRVASPDKDQDMWDFLLFSPSPQHTAALCLQRGPAQAPLDASSSWSTDSCDPPSGSRVESMRSKASDEVLNESSCSTASSDGMSLEGTNDMRVMRNHGPLEQQHNWRMQCWRTVPLMYDECMDPSEVLVQGYSTT